MRSLVFARPVRLLAAVCLVLCAVQCGGGAFTGESPDAGTEPPGDASVPAVDAAAHDGASDDDASARRDGRADASDASGPSDAAEPGDATEPVDARGDADDEAADSSTHHDDAGSGEKDAGEVHDASVPDASHPDAGSDDASTKDAGKCVVCGSDTACCAAGYCCSSLSLGGSTSYCPAGTGGGSGVIGVCPLASAASF
jgi:hypothetical protein